MEEKLIYVSFESSEYKSNKQDLLKAKIDLINLQKKLSHLLAIRQHKRRLMHQLHKLISDSYSSAEKIDNNLPDPSLPAKIRNQLVKKKEKKPKLMKHAEKPRIEFDINQLDQELIEIQRKLKQLNS